MGARCSVLQPSKDCVQKTLKRLEERMQGRVLAQILYSMHCADGRMRHRTATALARLAREQDLKHVFVDRKGLDILIGILTDPAREPLQLKEAAGARARTQPLPAAPAQHKPCVMVERPACPVVR
jgi:hypothetical protein